MINMHQRAVMFLGDGMIQRRVNNMTVVDFKTNRRKKLRNSSEDTRRQHLNFWRTELKEASDTLDIAYYWLSIYYV